MSSHGTGGRHTFSERKQSLRRELRERRKQIPGPYRREAAKAAARIVIRYLVARRAHKVAIYLSMGSELSTAPLVRLLRRRGVAVFAPALTRTGMRFRPLRGTFQLHRFGMLQPRSGPALRATEMDVVLMPLLGFDPRGFRLGQGGGWYDRSLGRNPYKPHRLGFAYAAQAIPDLPREPWDVPLHAVATEHGIIRFPRDLSRAAPCTTG